ncbi:Tripartite-type tricarboxylate transporter, receptor component TctC [Variovorax sp. OK605]|jgi:tripartite-type tricarboxylate transporter receptor subunit TctC|uniref:tripartite tricarboxylate transporter substrate binding protein n=1 Tax=unclassified Variovorax TaxID=663243 RepID=UPI0008C9DD44|nr:MULTISPECIES: tripartite tricarboxylate transporter substrate binding protein [unclassified Variovorax]SEK10409.1 Tripartite-type tricarboxylate transporter, receptor component TctC [Variovorax sp. OK202]SFD68162.1 Tripartite-type tricarboxylate transporter, receptor component TctC [Variovorax sp. OK212]SFQ10100.1 Tripartite-type tricarboxylate transporter, receptor component TctC [Variovorax sp. OK605]
MKISRPMARRQFVLGGLSAAAFVAAPARAFAATPFPERPLTFICPWPAGGTADRSMRVICQIAARELGQPIALENRAGASGMIGTKALASARPDGYTIGQVPISVTRFSQIGTVQIDPLKDLTYLTRTSGQTFGIAVLASSPFKSLRDMVAHAKAHPGALSYAHAGIGGATHVGMEQFAQAAGIKFNSIAYKGGAAALTDVLGGQVDMLADSSSWAPYIESGKMRLLATWGETRTPRFKDTPTLRELGYDVVVEAPNGIGAPKGLPPAVEQRLREAFRIAVNSEEFRKVAESIDAPVMYQDGPDYRKYVQAVYKQETELIRKLDLKALMEKG